MGNTRDDLLYFIALTKINGIGPVVSKQLISYCGGAKSVFNTSKKDLSKIPQIGQIKADLINLETVIRQSEKEVNFIEKNNLNAFTYLDDEYPGRLKNYDDAPIVLYYRGNGNLNPHHSVAIVGTRDPSEYGQLACERLVEELQPYSPTIISGMAYGVDSIAHRKSVELGMPTIGVLGHGLDRLYPASNRKLASQMIAQGGLLTEFPSETNPDRENFPMRNRIIAGMCDAIIVVESKSKGGSMITAELGNSYFKDVFALPGRVNDEKSQGCNLLIKSHKAALIEKGSDIGYIMRWEEVSSKALQQKLFEELDPMESQIVETLRATKDMTIDHLHYNLQIPVSELSGILLNMEFKGVIRSLPGKRYVLA